MRPGFPTFASRPRIAAAAVGLLVLAAGMSIGAARLAARAPAASLCTTAASMSDTDMLNASNAHFRVTPAHGNATKAAAAATYNVTNFAFDADNNLGTQVDVVHITAGQSVAFHWIAGVHTTTSGLPDDADYGSLWNFPVNSANHDVTVLFPDAGTYTFSCAFHGSLSNMVGTIVVDPGATPTAQHTWGGLKARYR